MNDYTGKVELGFAIELHYWFFLFMNSEISHHSLDILLNLPIVLRGKNHVGFLEFNPEAPPAGHK